MTDAQPKAQSPKPKAYVTALTLLARRELSEAQIRQRLARRGYPDEQVDDAVARLKSERAIDDTRVAEAIAHTETSLRKRGRARVRLAIERAGIDRSLARRAVDGIFADLAPDTHIAHALARRLRGRTSLKDESERRRLFRYLVSQGFDAELALKTLDRFKPDPKAQSPKPKA